MLETIAAHLDAFAAIAPSWGLALVCLFMAVESSFIPFPSEVVMIPAGFLAARGELCALPPAWAAAAAVGAGVAGSLAGAYLNYYLSLWLGKPFLEKYGKYFFVKRNVLDRACEVFARYGAATTFVCRLLPVIRQLISIPAGISRMPLGSFTLFTALGAGIWSAILAAAGFAIGQSAAQMSYLEIVQKGAQMAKSHLPAAVFAAMAVAAIYSVLSRIAMGRRGRKHA